MEDDQNVTQIGLLCLGASIQRAGVGPIQYTIQFLGAGTLNGNNFTARTVTFGFISDMTQITNLGGGILGIPNGIPSTYDLAGFSTGTLTAPLIHVFDNQGAQLVGINPSPDYLQLGDAAYAGYDLTTPIGPILSPTANFIDANGIATNNGQLILTSGRDFTFTAALLAVPEPADYALLGGGLSSLGLLRLRRG